MDEEQWDEAGEVGGGDPAVVVISYFDSMAQLRAQMLELWDELSLKFSDDAIAELRDLPFERVHLGLQAEIDSALECSVCIYPLLGGQHRLELGERSDALFQLSDDGGGWVDPHRLWLLIEQILDDILPGVGFVNRDEILARFEGGTRPLILCDPAGCPLELPDSDAGSGHC